jgi:hypothetical protein
LSWSQLFIMSSSPPPSSLATRLTSLAGQLRLGRREARHLCEQASHLRLPFQPLQIPPASIWWQLGLPLDRLVELPRDALSGPVQEDKAAAHAVLARLVEVDHDRLDALDLRQVDGLLGPPGDHAAHAHLDELASTPAGRNLRIISYKDFLKAISLALPDFERGTPLALRQADWLGPRLFWAGELHNEAFASAVAYARLRGLQFTLPAEVARYRLNDDALADLQAEFHMLAMPVQSWSDPAFMGLLLNSRLPYSRLSLLRTANASETLLLPRDNALSNALGEGLRLAGAPDLGQLLHSLLPAAN